MLCRSVNSFAFHSTAVASLESVLIEFWRFVNCSECTRHDCAENWIRFSAPPEELCVIRTELCAGIANQRLKSLSKSEKFAIKLFAINHTRNVFAPGDGFILWVCLSIYSRWRLRLSKRLINWRFFVESKRRPCESVRSFSRVTQLNAMINK